MKGVYRRWCREVIALAAPYALPEAALVGGVRELAGAGFDVSEFRRALEWNLARDYVRCEVNGDTDGKEWRLTALGRAKVENDG